jgi:hypothetical protein
MEFPRDDRPAELELILSQHREELRQDRQLFLQELGLAKKEPRRRIFRDNIAMFIAILTTLLAAWQGWLAREAGKDSQKSANAAEQSILIGERAYIGVDGKIVGRNEESTTAQFTIHATGNTPAGLVVGFAGCGVNSWRDVDQLAEQLEKNTPVTYYGPNLVPGAIASFQCLSAGQLKQKPPYQTNDVTVFVVRGRISYTDVLQNRHEIHFCLRSLVTGDNMGACKIGNYEVDLPKVN